jgi:hypothetical protein
VTLAHADYQRIATKLFMVNAFFRIAVRVCDIATLAGQGLEVAFDVVSLL